MKVSLGVDVFCVSLLALVCHGGLIGLVNKGKPRKSDDWGVLAAWSWGLSRALDYFETDKSVDAKQVGLEGHSRWGKEALIAMAFDQRCARLASIPEVRPEISQGAVACEKPG
jgi:hypothetical protein